MINSLERTVMKIITAIEVADVVSNKNNNPAMRASLLLYLEAVEREGFRFVKEETSETARNDEPS